jgi:hypothetical protein
MHDTPQLIIYSDIADGKLTLPTDNGSTHKSTQVYNCFMGDGQTYTYLIIINRFMSFTFHAQGYTLSMQTRAFRAKLSAMKVTGQHGYLL